MICMVNRLLKQPVLLCLISCIFCIVLTGAQVQLGLGQPLPSTGSETEPVNLGNIVLPTAQVHPLPTPLSQWQDLDHQGDYFDQVQPTSVGYLIWSDFPVQVYIQPADMVDTTGRSQAWYEAVRQALQEWTVYLPLELTSIPEAADVTIWRSAPPLQGLTTDPTPQSPTRSPTQSPVERFPRARSAETRYDILVQRSESAAILRHRFILYLSPSQTETYTRATARHELGHALGIWGHSPSQTDALYFSQVRNPPGISQRDVNTLKRVYEQPTRLGWPLPGVQEGNS